MRNLSWVTSPKDGRSNAAGRLALQMLIAPMTQLTFVSFELQAFLFLVFHQRRLAVLGHGIFMTTEHLFLMAWLRQFTFTLAPFGSLNAAMVFTTLVLAWYAAVAHAARLYGWFALTVSVVVALYFASHPVSVLFQQQDLSPLWGVPISASLVALSHAAEQFQPPRTLHPWRWTTVRDYLHAENLSLSSRVLRALHLVFIFINGAGAEAWASLRLMHYNWLFLMMRLGYAPDRYAELQAWTDRAWSTGQPALDYVGTGGGTFLKHDADA